MDPSFDRDEILRTWQLFRLPGEVLELRIPKAKKFKTVSGYFNDPNTFADAVVGLADGDFAGIYFTINPVRPDLLARAANRYVKYAESTTSDTDIAAIRWLPVDLDPKRPAGISSTDEEHAASLQKAQKIKKWLVDELCWPKNALILADSGNGAHLAARIELPNTPEAVTIIKQCLAALDSKFSDEVVHVDTTTYNPARIWKLYGTMSRKGDSTPERPHRMARILEAPDPDELALISVEMLMGLADMAPKAEAKSGTQHAASSGFDPKRYAEEHGATVLRVEPWTDPEGGKWELAILAECPFDPSHNRGEARIGVREDGARSFRCFHNSCNEKDWHALKKLWDTKRAAAIAEAMQHIDCEELTEGGNAARLERLHGEDLRYNHTHKKWYVWDGSRWLADSNGAASRLAADVIKMLYQEASEVDGKDARNAIVNFARQSDSRRGISNMLALAANRLKFALTANDFDKDRWRLGCENCTIDLRTGEICEPCREDLITKIIGAKYDPSAACPMWLKFLERILPDPDLRRYIKRAVGYCLTGSMAEQAFFFCYGAGANGKSTFLAVLRALLGEYAAQADFSSFLIQRNEKVRNDLAALAGSRLITAIEAEEGSRLSMQAIKAWTGGDPVTARFLFGENFTFQPEGKLWLAANNKPAITEHTHAAWRRVHLIPFTVTIPEAEQDKEIEQKLLRELPGILNWALEGLREYLACGLSAPRAVQDATDEYRRENNSLEQFVFECCELGKLKVCKNTELYTTYLNFCNISGLKAISQTKFSTELKGRNGVSSTRSKYGMVWLGIGLKSDWCRDEPNPTPQAGDQKGVGFEENAQSFGNFPLREDFTQMPTYPTPHSDCNPTPPKTLHQTDVFGQEKGEACKDEKLDKNKNESCQTPDDPDFRKFKEGMDVVLEFMRDGGKASRERFLKEFPEAAGGVRGRQFCAVCGEDLTGKSQITRGDKVYCPKPGCGYPRRGEEEVEA